MVVNNEQTTTERRANYNISHKLLRSSKFLKNVEKFLIGPHCGDIAAAY